MSGYIAGFPNTYAEKVGKTSDAMYKGYLSVRPLSVDSRDLSLCSLDSVLFCLHEHALLIQCGSRLCVSAS